jgi:hypothetical protein
MEGVSNLRLRDLRWVGRLRESFSDERDEEKQAKDWAGRV